MHFVQEKEFFRFQIVPANVFLFGEAMLFR